MVRDGTEEPRPAPSLPRRRAPRSSPRRGRRQRSSGTPDPLGSTLQQGPKTCKTYVVRKVNLCYNPYRMIGIATRVGRGKSMFFVLVGLAVSAVLAGSSLAAMGVRAATDPSLGYDISYPQCNGPFPSGAFGVAGVNGGKPYGANLCLGTGDGPSELSWAGLNAQLYANTADPGP